MRVKFAEATDTPSTPKISTWDHESCDQAPVNIALVLTGGGAFGAYQAGILEAILPTLYKLGKITSIAGTSAGTTNAIAAGSGLNASGPAEAIRRLRKLWKTISATGNPLGGLRSLWNSYLPPDYRWPNNSVPSWGNIFQNHMISAPAKFISETLKNIVKNWESEVQHGEVQISANTVLKDSASAGQFKHVVLTKGNLTPDGAGASANLKFFGTHHIKDTKNPEHMNRFAYDGAYFVNGPLPVGAELDKNVTDCIIIVLHDRRDNELDKGELKHAEIHSDVLDMMRSDSHSPIRFHSIEMESLGGEIGGLSHMNDSSKLNTDPEFINLLYESGIRDGKKWLEKNLQHIGQRTSYSPYQPALNQLEACYT